MMPNETLLQIIQKWNFWTQDVDAGIYREQYTKKIASYLDNKEILFLTGIRRCGKSTIMKQLMNTLVKNNIPKNNILYINLEEIAFQDYLSTDLLEQIYTVFRNYAKTNKKLYLFLDEIQEIDNWQKWIRTYYDRNDNVKFIISGSNSDLLSGTLATKLTGRQVTFHIKPLTYKEYLDFKINGSILEYLEFGGFPQVVLEPDNIKKRELLKYYFEDIINKDVINRNSLPNASTVLKIARAVCANSGGKLSYNKLAKHYGLKDTTVAQYIQYFIDSFLLIEVPFHSNSIQKRHSILTLSKYYAADIGFISITSLGLTKDEGKKFECAVLIEANTYRSDISYWDGDGEIDFIINNNAINVTFTDDIPEREFVAFKKFKDYTKFIVTKTLSKKEKGITLLPLEKLFIE